MAMLRMMIIFLCILNLESYAQERGRVVISEIMFDPLPAIGLPAQEYIEIYNCTNDTISLDDWKLGIGNEILTINFTGPFLPHGYLILGKTTATDQLASFGKYIAVRSFPSLPNESGLLYLKDRSGVIVHAVQYKSAWHSNSMKAQGGWSLELRDPLHPCIQESNWTSSIDPSGGTPGKPNSVAQAVEDHEAPFIRKAFMFDDSTAIIEFSEPVDSLLSADPTHFVIMDNPGLIESIRIEQPLFTQAIIKLKNPLTAGAIYEFRVEGIEDCAGNSIVSSNLKLGIALEADKSDIIINEIMFNPASGQKDYVEILNISQKPLSLQETFLSTLRNGQLTDPVRISDSPAVFMPGEYLVVTTDSSLLRSAFPAMPNGAVFQVSALPSLPDDKGTICINDEKGNIIDMVSYSAGWHLPFIADADGLALERIDPLGSSNDAGNWTSASTITRGTPGEKNSQLISTSGNMKASIEIGNSLFSPDGDGMDDVLLISYDFAGTPVMATIRVYDVYGHLVDIIIDNQLMDKKGRVKWEGVDSNNRPLPAGLYIVEAIAYNHDAKRFRYREAVTLARRQ